MLLDSDTYVIMIDAIKNLITDLERIDEALSLYKQQELDQSEFNSFKALANNLETTEEYSGSRYQNLLS